MQSCPTRHHVQPAMSAINRCPFISGKAFGPVGWDHLRSSEQEKSPLLLFPRNDRITGAMVRWYSSHLVVASTVHLSKALCPHMVFLPSADCIISNFLRVAASAASLSR